jgi:hypothetical protein
MSSTTDLLKTFDRVFKNVANPPAKNMHKKRKRTSRLSAAKRVYDGEGKIPGQIHMVEGKSNTWEVQSFKNNKVFYTVIHNDETSGHLPEWSCTCTDNRMRHTDCKHILYAQLEISASKRRKFQEPEDIKATT